MAANSRYHISIAYSGGEKGFITKKYSSRQKPDSLFGSRFSTGDISYSTMNRWQRYAQSSWMGGAYQKYLEDVTKFQESKNVDVLTSGEFRLSKKLGTALYTGASAISNGIYYNGAHYFAEGRYLKYTTDNFANVATSKDFGSGKVITDLEIYGGKLWACVGTTGVWYHDTTDHTTWAELKSGGATIPCNYMKSWGDNLYLCYTNLLQFYDGSVFTSVKNFAIGSDNTYFLKKPTVYEGSLLLLINTAGSSVGTGELWYYNGTTLDILYQGYDPIGSKGIVYNSVFIFAIYSSNKMILKQYNGSKVTTLKSFPTKSGTSLFGTGLVFGTGVKFGAASDIYDDPAEFIIWKENLLIIFKRTLQQNTILLYDTYGFTEYTSAPVGANFYASFWIYDRDVFVGGSDGKIYKLLDTYSVDGYIQSSIWDANLQDINKLFADITVKYEALTSGDSIDVYYRTEGSQSFTLLGSITTAASVKQTLAFPTGIATVLANQLEYKIVLNSGSGATSPVVQDVIVRYLLAPDNSKRVFEYTIECSKLMKLLDDTFEVRTPEEIFNDLWTLRNSNELLVLTDEDGETHTVIFSDTSPEAITAFAGDDVTERYIYLRLFEL